MTHGLGLSVLLALGHAVLFALAFPERLLPGRPVGAGLWPLAPLAVLPLAWMALRARSTRRAVLVAVAAQLVMWLWLQRWVAAVTLPGYPLLALYSALYAGLFVWIVRRIDGHPRLGRWPMAIVVPTVWVALEGLRGEIVFHGYPWFLLAHPLVEWPLVAQVADLLGAYLVSFLVAAVSGAGIDLLRASAAGAPHRGVLPAAVVLAGWVAAGAYGAWRLAQTPAAVGTGPTILAIQTNLPQDNKIAWTLDAMRRDVPEFVELTNEAYAATGRDADLVVWPETMLPVHGLEVETLETLARWDQRDELSFARDVLGLRRELGTSMLVGSACFVGLGVEDHHWIWDRQYNSAYLLVGGEAPQRYDKNFLTPFGEVMPYISAWPWLESKLLAIGAPGMSFALSSSPEPAILELPWQGERLALATPICFEDAVPRVCRRMVYEGGRKRVRLLVNLSNDGWFGDHDAGRAQHAQIARYRCIENRVPMVRCANTGMSVSIDSAGRLRGTVGLTAAAQEPARVGRVEPGRARNSEDRPGGGDRSAQDSPTVAPPPAPGALGRYGLGRRAGWLESTVSLDRRETLYGRVGDVWPMICLAATGLLVAASYFFRRGKG